MKGRDAIRQKPLITSVEKSLVWDNEETKKVRVLISATEEGRNLRPKRSRSGSMLLRKERGDGSEEEADDDALLVKPSPKCKSLASSL